MPNDRISRRTVLASAGAAAPLAATPHVAGIAPFAQAAPGRPAGTPIKIVTMYKFEAPEVETIVQRAAEHAPVEIKICASPQEFRAALRDAEVVYGEVKGADLDYAPRLKWVQSGGAGVEGIDEKFRNSPTRE